MAGQAGRYYLIYFGEEQPTSWAPKFYRNGLTDGMEFKAEVLDTWNMTATPVEGVITTKKLDRYSYGDRDGREIKMPGRKYMAIRFQWVGGAEPVSTAKPPIEP